MAVLAVLFGRVSPYGPRYLSEDFGAVRLLAERGTRSSDFARYPDGGTTVGLSAALPVRASAELPVADDRSAWLQVPSHTALRLQLLDKRGMMLGTQLDRYYYTDGLETVSGGTNQKSYGHSCAPCHGAISGNPKDAQVPAPDAISAASLTLAAYSDRNPRAPRKPQIVSAVHDVDFVTTIKPLLAKHCATSGCHAGATAAAALRLDDETLHGRFPAAYADLVQRSVSLTSLRARQSELIERLLGEKLDAPGPLKGHCPPGAPKLELVNAFVRFIESGAFYDLSAREPAHAP